MGDVDALQEAEEATAQRQEQEARAERERLQAELQEPPVKETAELPRVPEMVPLDQIVPGVNIRGGDMEKIENLALSIKERGLWSPLILRHAPAGALKPYQLVAGFRRYAALQLAYADEASRPVRSEVIEDLSDAEVAELQLLENAQRVQLKPLEVARALRLILSENPSLTAAAVARSMGLKPEWVRRHFRLLDLPEEVQARLEGGDLSFTVADLLRRAGKKGQVSEDEVKELAEQVAAGEVTSKELKERLSPPRPETPLAEADEAAWAELPAAEEEARRRELERQADDLLARAPKSPTGSPAGDSDDVVFTDWSSDSTFGRPPIDYVPPATASALVAALDNQALDSYLLGRLLRDLVDDGYLAELGIERDEAVDYATALEHADVLDGLRAASRRLALYDPSLPASSLT